MKWKFKQVKKFSLKIKDNLRKPKLNTLKYDFYLILGEQLLWKQNASYIITLKYYLLDFPGDTVDENPPANAGDMGSIPGLGRSHMPQSTKPMCHSWGTWEPTATEACAPTACVPQGEPPQ